MGPRLPCVSFPKDDPNHYALYRLFIIARFCAPPFPDALVETSRQRPSPAPEIGGRILLYALSVPVSAAPAFLPNMPFRLDADFVPVIKIRPQYNVLVANLAGPAKSVSRVCGSA
jgi:hypothetical protein